jgi:hypothetical protein
MNRLVELAKSAKENNSIIDTLRDNDGLVPTSELIINKKNNSFDLYLRKFPKVEVFPHIQLSSVIPILSRTSSLWASACLDIKAFPPMSGRIQIFGVPLIRAFKEVQKKGITKSHFALLKESYEQDRGTPADLLIHVSRNRKDVPNIVEIEIWEDVRISSEVFYGHSFCDYETEIVNHLDCATMHFSEEQKLQIFQGGVKIKGNSYQKHFRVDGKISLIIALDLMRAYFPIEELFNESIGYDQKQ